MRTSSLLPILLLLASAAPCTALAARQTLLTGPLYESPQVPHARRAPACLPMLQAAHAGDPLDAALRPPEQAWAGSAAAPARHLRLVLSADWKIDMEALVGTCRLADGDGDSAARDYGDFDLDDVARTIDAVLREKAEDDQQLSRQVVDTRRARDGISSPVPEADGAAMLLAGLAGIAAWTRWCRARRLSGTQR